MADDGSCEPDVGAHPFDDLGPSAREAAHFIFGIAATSVAALSLCELLLMRATTPAEALAVAKATNNAARTTTRILKLPSLTGSVAPAIHV